jgi:hypothetical protein
MQMAMLAETLPVSLAVILVCHLKRASISNLIDNDGLDPHQDEVYSVSDAGHGGDVFCAASRNRLNLDLHRYYCTVSDLADLKIFCVLNGPQYLDGLVQMALAQDVGYYSRWKVAEPLLTFHQDPV